LQDFEIAYTFGVYPLQQYLIGFPTAAIRRWYPPGTAAPKSKAGSAGFHLYPDQNLTHRDPLHWTGLQQNWNYMCAECHSTNLRKNYDPSSSGLIPPGPKSTSPAKPATFPARSPRLDRKEGDWQKLNPTKGLAIALDERRGLNAHLRALAMKGLDLVTPVLNPSPACCGRPGRQPTASTRRARRLVQPRLELCARCHARRAAVSGRITSSASRCWTPTAGAADARSLLSDGQMKDECSTMARSCKADAGEGGELQRLPRPAQRQAAPPRATRFACNAPGGEVRIPAPPFSSGGFADARTGRPCHAPATTYMIVDPRHDHSFRFPART